MAANTLSEECSSYRNIGFFLTKVDAFALFLHCLFIVSVRFEYYIGVDALVGARHAHLG